MIWLLGDIGGTNARFALLYGDGELSAIEHRAVADHPDPESAIEAVLEQRGVRPDAAVLAVAATVEGSGTAARARLTNGAWSFESRALARRLGFAEVTLVNDFAAIALAVPRLAEAQCVRLGGGPGRLDAPIAVLGPGTGLGVATLLPDQSVLVGEGGHVTLPAVDDREAALLAILRRRFGHVSAERVLSGPGLVSLHGAVAELDGHPVHEARDGAEVVAAASAGCPGATSALDAFFAFLGSVAGNVVLTVGGLGGVYLAGGILPRLIEPLRASRFRERFEAKGRFAAYLKPVPARLIVEPDPAFLGLANLARGLEAESAARRQGDSGAAAAPGSSALDA